MFSILPLYLSFHFVLKTGSCYVAQAGFKTMILLPQPLSSGTTGMHHNTSPSMFSSCGIFKLEKWQVTKI